MHEIKRLFSHCCSFASITSLSFVRHRGYGLRPRIKPLALFCFALLVNNRKKFVAIQCQILDPAEINIAYKLPVEILLLSWQCCS